MEQRAPKLASADKILGSLMIIATAVNFKIDILENSGLSIEEYISLTLNC